MVAAQVPRRRAPARRIALVARDRQRVADRLAEAAREHVTQAIALGPIGQLGVARLDVDRQAAFAPEPVADVLVGREHVAPVDAHARRETAQEFARVRRGRAVGLSLARDERVVVPDRHAVLAPEEVERPARQLLARIPLALAEVDEAAGTVVLPAGAPSARRSARAWSAPSPRCSTRRPRDRRPRRRWARRPWVRRTSIRRRSASTCLPSSSTAPHCSSV